MVERLKKMLKREKGFTLVELLAVIAILAIVVAIAVPTIGNVISESTEKAEKANAELFENAARLASVSGASSATDGSYTLEELVNAKVLEEIPVKPGTDAKYDASLKVKKVDDVWTFNPPATP